MSKVIADGRPAPAEQGKRSRRSKWTRRGVKVVAFGAAAAVGLALGVAAGVTAAGAAPLVSWSDTSVAASTPQLDQVDSISGSYTSGAVTTPLTVGGTVTITAPKNNDKIAFTAVSHLVTANEKWSIPAGGTSNLDGYTPTIDPTTGVLTVAAPTTPQPITGNPVVKVEVTDGLAVGFATLTFVPHLTGGTVTTLDVTLNVDTVQLGQAVPFNNNTNGTVVFTTTPATGVTTSLGNAPTGLVLNGDVLKGNTAVPGHYSALRVTGTDAGGAIATADFSVTVKGVPAIVPPTIPFVYGGHVLTVDAHNATVSWSDGIPDNATAWGSGMVNGHVNHCVEVFVYGFDRPAGQAHVGFTCDNGNPLANIGYLRDLAAGHEVALFVQPATGTYGNNHPIPETNPAAHITVITSAH